MMIKLIFCPLLALFKSRRQLILENTALRYEVFILKRKGRRVNLRAWDRMVLVWYHKHLSNWKSVLTIVEPETIIRWHRKGFSWYWGRSSNKGGRNTIPPDAIRLIQEICRKNPRWGVRRIHGELLKLGINVCQATVAKYRWRIKRPLGPNWKTFLKNHAHETIAIDFFRVPSVKFELLWALVVLSHDRREIVHTAVTKSPSAPWTMQQLRDAYAYRDFPKYLIHDRDGNFRGLHRLGVKEITTSFRSPWQNAYVERAIGTIKRECTNHIIPLGEKHLSQVLEKYADYYNTVRTHVSLNKDSPLGRPIEKVGRVVCQPRVGGLHHHFFRVAA